MKELFNAVQLSHDLISRYLRVGMTAADATCGNGNDTVFLAKRVGPDGRVFAFDIQKEAIEAAKALAAKEGLTNITFIHDGHENIKAHITTGIDCVVFNLGYLPSSVSKVTTKKRTSVRALKAALSLLNPDGMMVCCAYVSHNGGMREFHAMKRALRRLDAALFQTMVFDQPNRKKCAPKVLFCKKKS